MKIKLMNKSFKFIFAIFIFLFSSCETYKHSYNERRNLMILKNYEQPRNKKFNSKEEVKKKRKTYRKFKHNR